MLKNGTTYWGLSHNNLDKQGTARLQRVLVPILGVVEIASSTR